MMGRTEDTQESHISYNVRLDARVRTSMNSPRWLVLGGNGGGNGNDKKKKGHDFHHNPLE